ncbi:MAG: hypothetical protein U1E14_10890 [Geminicoccaceae bacterium]
MPLPRFAAALLLAGALAACAENPYAGTYRGTFATVGTGYSDRGIWNADVNQVGYLKGRASSSAQGRNFAFDGEVDAQGRLKARVGVGAKSADFTGTIDPQGTVKGTWDGLIGTRQMEGTFEGAKVR